MRSAVPASLSSLIVQVDGQAGAPRRPVRVGDTSRRLLPALPSARKMADLYGVGVMTIQRALREPQNMRVTYSIAGKGTFVHPDTVDRRDDATLITALADPARVRSLGRYLARQFVLLDQYETAEGTKAKNAAARELADHAQAHADLLAQLTIAATTPVERPPAGPDFHGKMHGLPTA